MAVEYSPTIASGYYAIGETFNLDLSAEIPVRQCVYCDTKIETALNNCKRCGAPMSRSLKKTN